MQKVIDVVQLQGCTPLVNPSSIAVFTNGAATPVGFQLSPALRVGMNTNFISNPIAIAGQTASAVSAYAAATPVAFLVRVAGVINTTSSSTTKIGLTFGSGTGTVLSAGTVSGALTAPNSFFVEYEMQWDGLSLVLNGALVAGNVGGTLQAQTAFSQTAVANQAAILLGVVATNGTSNAANTLCLSEFSLNYL